MDDQPFSFSIDGWHGLYSLPVGFVVFQFYLSYAGAFHKEIYTTVH